MLLFFLLRLACTCEETCESVWPPNASLHASWMCVHLPLASPFGQDFSLFHISLTDKCLSLSWHCIKILVIVKLFILVLCYLIGLLLSSCLILFTLWRNMTLEGKMSWTSLSRTPTEIDRNWWGSSTFWKRLLDTSYNLVKFGLKIKLLLLLCIKSLS